MNKIKLIKLLIKQSIKSLNKDKLLNTRIINKNLTIYNNKYDYKWGLYNYNNNNMLNNMKNKYIISNYINYLMSYKLKKSSNKLISILYNKSITLIKDNNTIEVILFILKPEYGSNLFRKIINNIINQSILKNIKANTNNINIKITPILLKYNYLDSTIYSKYMSNLIKNFTKFDKIKNNQIKSDIKDILLNNKLNNFRILNNIKKLILLGNYELNKNLIINNNILHQNIIGYSWQFKGKKFNTESTARSEKYYMYKGKLNWLKAESTSGFKSNSQYKLNKYPASLSIANTKNTTKNGLYNIKVQLNHF